MQVTEQSQLIDQDALCFKPSVNLIKGNTSQLDDEIEAGLISLNLGGNDQIDGHDDGQEDTPLLDSTHLEGTNDGKQGL